jgi:hypothetical protein
VLFNKKGSLFYYSAVTVCKQNIKNIDNKYTKRYRILYRTSEVPSNWLLVIEKSKGLKQLEIIKGATHYEIYEREKCEQTAALELEWFNKLLNYQIRLLKHTLIL